MASASKQLTEKDLVVFLTSVRDHFDVLFGRLNGTTLTKDVKENEWKKVAKECAEQGVDRFLSKPLSVMRDDVYGYRKKKVKAKYDAAKRTGAAPAQHNQWESLMVELLTEKTNELEAEESQRYKSAVEEPVNTENGNPSISATQPMFESQFETPIANKCKPAFENFLLPKKPKLAQKRLFDHSKAPVSPKTRRMDLQNAILEKDLELRSKDLILKVADIELSQRQIQVEKFKLFDMQMKHGVRSDISWMNTAGACQTLEFVRDDEEGTQQASNSSERKITEEEDFAPDKEMPQQLLQ